MQTRSAAKSLYPYQNRCVRDLAWAIASPPLMLPPQAKCRWFDTDWYRQLHQQSLAWLHSVDQQPEALQRLLDDNRDRRLGSYFETLWAYYFMHSPRFSLLARNQQIIQDGRTLGELDFIVRDHVEQKTQHIEVAVKFYLGLADTRLQKHWYGPGKKDRLDIKMQSLLQRQSVFASTPSVAEQLAVQGIQVDDCAVILKGRLFYPDATVVAEAAPPEGSHPRHLRSRWLRLQDFVCEPDSHYMPLIRSGWLAGQDWRPEHCFEGRQTLTTMLDKGELRLPLMLLVFRGEQEVERVFVMPDDWAEMDAAK